MGDHQDAGGRFDEESASTERLGGRWDPSTADWSGRASAPSSDTSSYGPARSEWAESSAGGTGGSGPWWPGEPGEPPAGGSGYGPPAFGSAPYGAPTPPPRRRRRAMALGGAAVLVIGAGAAAAATLAGNGPAAGGGAIPRPGATTDSVPNKINVGRVAATVTPAVVDITAIDGYQSQTDAGTGMVLTANGDVLTNNHVVEGATRVTARIDGKGRTYQVRVLGTDATDDVALVQLQGASGLKTVTVGNSSVVKIGQPVVAIGNALDLSGSPTVTDGTISALGRSITASDSGTGTTENLHGLLQTDAPIEPGNSGGPLVNAAGQVIGMNTAAASATSASSVSNVGFAIPINRALNIARQIEQGQASATVHVGSTAFLGVEVAANRSAASGGLGFGNAPAGANVPGALVEQIVPGTPAARSGLAPGDVITAVDGHQIRSASQLTQTLAGYHPGQRATIHWTDPSGNAASATVTLATGPTA
jgi:S1-C subfamily serine protease